MKRSVAFVVGLFALMALAVPLQTASEQATGAAEPSAPIPDPKSAVVPRFEAEVKIDGVLDEPPWQKAVRLTPFVRHDTMAPARVSTEVRLWYDRTALYLGWNCEDGDIQATIHAARQPVLGRGSRRVLSHRQRSTAISSCNGIHSAEPSMPSSRTRSVPTAARSGSPETGLTRRRT